MDNKERKQIKEKWSTPVNQKKLKELEVRFGKYKKVVLSTTGKAYKVPTKDILTIGLKGADLEKYPEWDEK